MPDPNTPPAVLPTGEDYLNMADDGRRWRVVGTTLGGLAPGSVVGIRQLQPGCHLAWLIDQGSLVELSADEIEAAEASAPPVMPRPYMATEAAPTPKMAPAPSPVESPSMAADHKADAKAGKPGDHKAASHPVAHDKK